MPAPAARPSLQTLNKQHSVFVRPIVVKSARDTLVLAGRLLHLEAHALMKRNRVNIDGRRHATDGCTTAVLHGLKGLLVELARQPALSMVGMNPDEVNVGLIRVSLRNKPGQERDYFPTLFDGEAGVAKNARKIA